MKIGIKVNDLLTLHCQCECIASIAVSIGADTRVQASVTDSNIGDGDVPCHTIYLSDLQLFCGCTNGDTRVSSMRQHSPVPIPADSGAGDTSGLAQESDHVHLSSNSSHLIRNCTGHHCTKGDSQCQVICIFKHLL